MFEKPHRAEITEPQLASLIDVFSILIIFLIAGTVMGNTAVVLPDGMLPPKSASKESMVVAPQVTLTSKSVLLSFSEREFPLEAFRNPDSGDFKRFQSDIARFAAAQKGKENDGLINFVADHSMNYDRIFMVLKALREAGMKSILFVSMSLPGHA